MMLITPDYQAEQARLHRERDDYGVECMRYGSTIGTIVQKHQIDTMLDYGSGKGRIVDAVAPHLGDRDLQINLYDPGIAVLAEKPDPAELVTCIDVLEHVEPEFTRNVIEDIHRCATKRVFITIGLTPAAKMLSDGRNAHINLRHSNAWLLMLMDYFFIDHFMDAKRSAIYSGAPKK